MIGFDDGTESEKSLDGKRVAKINPNLTSQTDVTKAATLSVNLGCCFIGTKKAGKFEVAEPVALPWLDLPNPHGRPNSDVLRPWVNGNALVTVRRAIWIVDAGNSMPQELMASYEQPFQHVLAVVKSARDKNNEKRTKANFWIHKRPSPEMRSALTRLDRCVAVVRHSKHLVFCWLKTAILPDDGIYIFAREDDLFFGILASRFHAAWAYAQGTQVREKESGFRYTPLTCFETFPFPCPTETQEAAIATAAKELNELRERWLNPTEWTETRTLEFPGSVIGPWARFIDPKSVNAMTKIGTVRYPRLEPRDADCATKLKKRTLTNLYNERPTWLDLAHKKLDAAVAAAYGWPIDLSDEDILTRLLELNLACAKEETKAAADKARKTGANRPQRQKKEDEML